MLVAEHLSVTFGGVHAVRDISLDVAPGEVLGVIGPNGAGKTTLVNLLTGYVKLRSGKLLADGYDYTGLPPHRIWRLGIVRSFQAATYFASATVAECLQIAIDGRSGNTLGGTISAVLRPRRSDGVSELVTTYGLESVGHLSPGSLPYGQQKVLGVALGVAASPRVLLLDEPAAGLTHGEALQIGSLITRLAASGIGILVIDHNVRFMREICSRLLVMSYGQQIALGATDAVLADPAVIAAYLGDIDASDQ